MQRGRKSTDHLSIVGSSITGTRSAIIPLRKLTSDEKAIFDLVVRENAHLTQGDVPLLMVFARATAATFDTTDATSFEKLARVSMSAATRLRLTQQSRTHPTTLARARRDGSGLSYYERMAIEEQH